MTDFCDYAFAQLNIWTITVSPTAAYSCLQLEGLFAYLQTSLTAKTYADIAPRAYGYRTNTPRDRMFAQMHKITLRERMLVLR